MKPLKFAENVIGLSKRWSLEQLSSLLEGWAGARRRWQVLRRCRARCVMFGLDLSARPAEATVNTAADCGDCEPFLSLTRFVSCPPPSRRLRQCTSLLWRCWTPKAARCVSRRAASSPTWPWSPTTEPASRWRGPPPSKSGACDASTSADVWRGSSPSRTVTLTLLFRHNGGAGLLAAGLVC